MTAVPGSHPSVYDLGLSGVTEADGLAVPRASPLATAIAAALIDGIFTLDDVDLFRFLALAFETEALKLEPSAAAGLAGPGVLTGTPAGREHLERAGLGDRLAGATHVIWTTGGKLLPFDEHVQCVSRDRLALA